MTLCMYSHHMKFVWNNILNFWSYCKGILHFRSYCKLAYICTRVYMLLLPMQSLCMCNQWRRTIVCFWPGVWHSELCNSMHAIKQTWKDIKDRRKCIQYKTCAIIQVLMHAVLGQKHIRQDALMHTSSPCGKVWAPQDTVALLARE